MRLHELNPEWMDAGGEGISNADGSPTTARHGVGVMCDCPCGNKDGSHRLYVPFANPLDGGPPMQTGKNNGWQRAGDTFESLTLTPSIHRIVPSCGWHGFITNGEVLTV